MPAFTFRARSTVAIKLVQAAYLLLGVDAAPRLCARVAYGMVGVARRLAPELSS